MDKAATRHCEAIAGDAENMDILGLNAHISQARVRENAKERVAIKVKEKVKESQEKVGVM